MGADGGFLMTAGLKHPFLEQVREVRDTWEQSPQEARRLTRRVLALSRNMYRDGKESLSGLARLPAAERPRRLEEIGQLAGEAIGLLELCIERGLGKGDGDPDAPLVEKTLRQRRERLARLRLRAEILVEGLDLPTPGGTDSPQSSQTPRLSPASTEEVRIALLSYLRTCWAVLWTTFAHPFRTTLIDATTGRVVST